MQTSREFLNELSERLCKRVKEHEATIAARDETIRLLREGLEVAIERLQVLKADLVAARELRWIDSDEKALKAARKALKESQ